MKLEKILIRLLESCSRKITCIQVYHVTTLVTHVLTAQSLAGRCASHVCQDPPLLSFYTMESVLTVVQMVIHPDMTQASL